MSGFQFTARSVRTLGVIAIGVVASFGTLNAAKAAPAAKVKAVYTISHPLASGSFHFSSISRNGRYKAQGTAEVNALLGFYTWQSKTTATGRMSGARLSAGRYDFRYSNNGKPGKVQMKFPLSSANAVKAVPPIGRSSKRVPVKQAHLKGALDPLTAVLAMSAVASKEDPCRRNIPIFDGKQRFDIRMSSKRKTVLPGGSGHGLSRTAFVCSVTYRPIAGYKPNKETSYMANSRGIEVWLVPAPKAGLYVPYQITIPTIAGTASIQMKRIDIDTDGRRQVAFVN